MSLINQISGSLLVTLASRSEESSTSSALNGFAQGSSFDGASVDIRPGLSIGARAFVDSLDRLNIAISAFSISKEQLDKIKDSVDNLTSLASTATDTTLSSEAREDLNSRFLREILVLEEAMAGGVRDDKDYLEMSDLDEVLEDAGIDSSVSTLLNQTISRLAGRDGALGFERVRLADESIVDPTSLSVGTLADARRAFEAFSELQKEVNRDQEGISLVFDELRAAAKFARAGAIAFDDAIDYAVNVDNADRVANLILQSIRTQTSDRSLREHSSIDSLLAEELLNPSS